MSVTVHVPVNIVANAARLRAILVDAATLAPPAGKLNGGKIRLFQNNVTPGPDTVLADLTVATFDGYADSPAVVWGGGDTDVEDRAVLIAPSITFSPTGAVIGNTIHWWAFFSLAPDTLVCAERLPNPVVLAGPGDALVIVPMFRAGVS